MTWRVAESLDVLLEEINKRSPHRSKVSDGSIGNAAHAARDSDHNPWVKDGATGVVTARDFTNDPGDGFDSSDFADWLRKRCKAGDEHRVKYVISDRRIASASFSASDRAKGRKAWEWWPYNGLNAHLHHVHVSVSSTKSLYDSTRPWGWETAGNPKPAPPKQEDDPMAGITLDQIKAAIREAVPTTEEIAAQVITDLTSKPIAINKPSDSELAAAKAAGKPVPVGSAAPLAWFVQNIEQDGDNAAAAILGKLEELLTAVRELAAAIKPEA